jgi:hypothetical protein
LSQKFEQQEQVPDSPAQFGVVAEGCSVEVSVFHTFSLASTVYSRVIGRRRADVTTRHLFGA